jgi:hypothetical protein
MQTWYLLKLFQELGEEGWRRAVGGTTIKRKEKKISLKNFWIHIRVREGKKFLNKIVIVQNHSVKDNF